MGIYDRDYYRQSGSSYFHSFGEGGQVCKWLIGINVVVFIVQILTTQNPEMLGFFTNTFELNSSDVLTGKVWQLLTYSFLHDPYSLWHIAFNMLFLWWFGAEIETMYGSKEFLAFYLMAAFLGGIAFTLQGMFFSLSMTQSIFAVPSRCIGASGAVMAVMVLYACHFPHRRILLFFILPIPIWLFVGFQVVQDAFVFAHGAQTGVAVGVHLTGAVFAFLYYRQHWRVSNWFSQLPLQMLRSRRRRPKLRVYHGEEFAHAVSRRSDVDEQFEAKLDTVLEKIKLSGQSSLTEDEREILTKASELYKQKRST